MAFFKTFGSDVAIGESGYDPQKLSSPQVFLLSMVVFLAIVGFIAAILYRQISHAFVTNPGLNGLIIGVLAIGILLAFTQVVRLFREVRWVNSFRAGSDGHRSGTAGADEGVAVPLLDYGAVDQLDALDARFDRQPP